MDTSFLRLACSVILQALRDIQSNNKYKEEAKEWLNSPVAQGWLETLGITNASPERVQELTGQLATMSRIIVSQPPVFRSSPERREQLEKTMQRRYREMGSPFEKPKPG
ncbi:MAG: hypothetical protein JXA42_10715 [Anaerolineales bacterium]|nr:hypothetical protein [Anaerolineales bacterium]